MSNLSDKDIDRLSREAADLYEPGESNLSWSRLEQRLTEQMPGRPPDGFRFGRINPYVWGPAVVLFAGISFYIIKNIYYSQHSTRTGQITSQADSSSLTPHPSGSAVAESKTDPEPSDVIASSKNSVSANKNLLQSDNNTANYSGSSRSENGSLKKGSGSKYLLKASATTAATGAILTGKSYNASNKRNGTTGSGESNNLTTASASISNNEVANRERSTHGLPSIVTAGVGRGKVTGIDSLLSRLNELKTPVLHKSLRLNRSLNFGITFGPDYTDGGGITNNQFSNNIGVMVGYYLTNKISVNTGILYSNKFFWVPGKQVNTAGRSGLTQGYASNYAAPPEIKYINGSANLYELPLTLRYDFAHNEKTKFFANAGFSSYFIIKQTSIYFSDRTPLALEVTDESQMDYWFKVANLSLGFETDMGKGFSFQVEPFAKLPFKNMGIENVKLNSYGVLLSFRFSPVLSRTKK